MTDRALVIIENSEVRIVFTDIKKFVSPDEHTSDKIAAFLKANNFISFFPLENELGLVIAKTKDNKLFKIDLRTYSLGEQLTKQALRLLLQKYAKDHYGIGESKTTVYISRKGNFNWE